MAINWRFDTAANWAVSTTILGPTDIAVELDSDPPGKSKRGDGLTPYPLLQYSPSGQGSSNIIATLGHRHLASDILVSTPNKVVGVGATAGPCREVDGGGGGGATLPDQINGVEKNPPTGTDLRMFAPLDVLDIASWLAQPAAFDILNTPPGTPVLNRLYIVGASPTGIWSGLANNVVKCTSASGSGTYVATPPVDGMMIRVSDLGGVANTNAVYWYDGSGWFKAGLTSVSADNVTETTNNKVMTAAERTELAQWAALSGTGYPVVTSGVPSLVPATPASGYVAAKSSVVISSPTTTETQIFGTTIAKEMLAFTGASVVLEGHALVLAIGGANGTTGSQTWLVNLYFDGAKAIGDTFAVNTNAVDPRLTLARMTVTRMQNPATPTDATTDLIAARFEMVQTGGNAAGGATPDYNSAVSGAIYSGNLTAAAGPSGNNLVVIGLSHIWTNDLLVAAKIVPPDTHGVAAITGSPVSTVWKQTR